VDFGRFRTSYTVLQELVALVALYARLHATVDPGDLYSLGAFFGVLNLAHITERTKGFARDERPPLFWRCVSSDAQLLDVALA
jgi:hypothetical protein